MMAWDTLQARGSRGRGLLVLAAFILAVMVVCAAAWPLSAFAESAPPTPQLLASYDLGGAYSNDVSIACLSEDGRYAAVSSERGEYAMTYVVDLDTGERRRLPDVDYGYEFYPLGGSRALAASKDGLMLCDLATSELEPLSIDIDTEGNVAFCKSLGDGKTVGLAMTDGDGTYTCVAFDVDAQAATKQVSLHLSNVSSIYIADDASQIFVISYSDDGDPYLSVYGFDGAAPERSVALSSIDSGYASYILFNQIDASTMEVLNTSPSTGRWSFERLDTETGDVEPMVDDAAVSWEFAYDGGLLAIVDPQSRFGDTVSSDALGRLEMRSVDLASGETCYQCQVPAALYGCTLQYTDLSRDGRYFYTPNDLNGSSTGLSSLSVVDVGSGAVTNLPLALADGSELHGMLLSEDDSRLVLLTVDDADGSMNMALSVYDTGIGGDPFAALLTNTPVLIIIVVAVLVVAALVVGALIFIGRRRHQAAPVAATARGGSAAGAPSFCPQCGQRIEAPDAAFCPRCGAPLKR